MLPSQKRPPGPPGSVPDETSRQQGDASPASPPPRTTLPPLRGQAQGDSARLEGVDLERAANLAAAKRAIATELGRRIIGQSQTVDLLLVALFARGHALLVGVPGLAKTMLVHSLAEVLGLGFGRIQFTPDLMPSDVTGTDVIEDDVTTGKKVFRFVPGPVFTNLLLADEINRTPPKTQAALLQAMQERVVSVGGATRALPAPFWVLATQNPIEHEGTFPLPEAQLDRFLLQIDVSYPSEQEEVEVVRRHTSTPLEPLRPCLPAAQILPMLDLVLRVPAAEHVVARAVRLVRSSRPETESASAYVKRYVSFGAGPRASQALVSAAKAAALLDGRFAAEVEDIERLARPVLGHRIVPSFAAQAERVSAAAIVDQLLDDLPRP